MTFVIKGGGGILMTKVMKNVHFFNTFDKVDNI